MQQPGRKFSNEGSYRYSFNGQEKSSELNEAFTRVAGTNSISYDGTEDNPQLYAKLYDQAIVPNSIGVVISQYVNFKDPDETRDYVQADGKTTNHQFLLNHEAGHFLYEIAFTSKYIKFQKALLEKGQSLEGGHSKDDESGKNAVKYGSVKDF